MKVFIMRGIPGSGKSTWILNNVPGSVTCSADYYFIQADGTYKHDPSKIGLAHQECFRSFMQAINAKAETIVVDNTNTQVWEYAPYLLAAETFGYDVEIVRINVDPEVAAARNVHGVPAKAIKSMVRYFEPALPWHNETVL